MQFEHRAPLSSNYRRSLRLPLGWFTSDQQRHLVAHRMRDLPTLMVLAECS